MKRWMVVLLLGLVVAIVHLQVFTSSWGERLEPLGMDLWFNIRGPIAPPDDVVVVAMDEHSYDILGFPMDKAWPRAMHAEILKRLHEYGARRVVMDILFLGEGSDPKANQALAEALKLNPTVIGADWAIEETSSATGRFSLERVMQPLEMFSKNAENVAIARLPIDYEYVRRFEVPKSSETRDIPSLFEAALGPSYKTQTGPRDFLWYYGPPGAIPTYPFHQVLNNTGKLPQNVFKDKVVFIGLSLRSELGPAQKDAYHTPFNEGTFGVEIQATAAANLISGKWIKRLPAWIESTALFFITLILCSAIFWLRPQWGGLVLVGFSIAWAITSYLAFLSGHFVPGALLVSTVLPLSFLGSTLAYYFISHRSQQQVEKAFQMYLSPEMARQMRDDPKVLGLGGEDVYATALFTDIEGFTATTEGMLASDVASMLNAYFTEVMDVIFNNKGTLIKFIGDAVFALWGAPIKIPDHARLSCETALIMQKEVRKFNQSKRFPALNTRIGLNTGPMVVGNLGSSRRFDFTAIGDSVNLASRLESLNKQFGTWILVSESTRKEAGSKFSFLSLGTIKASGKKESVGVYALFEEAIPTDVENQWLKAINKFRIRAWDEAEAQFRAASENEVRLKKAAGLYLGEIAHHRISEPEESWQGEIEFLTK